MSDAPTKQKRATPKVARPTRVNVGGQEWELIWFPTEDEFKKACYEVPDAQNLNAATFPWERVIRLGSFMSVPLQQENLLHELMHACCYLFRTDGDDGGPPPDRDWEEHYISGLDGILLGVLRMNPQLTRWLLQ